LFWKFGVRSVTMEDIAKELGISKKTIYQHFTDKDDILYQVIQEKVRADTTEMDCMAVETANPIEGLMMVLEIVRKNQHEVSPNLLMDIKRYHPQAFALFRQHIDQHIMKSILENIQKGVSQGLYRSDINPAILARMRVEQIELAFNNEFFPTNQYSMLDIQRELIHHFVRGMLTDQGFIIYNQYVNQHNYESAIYQTNDTGLAAHPAE